jgi:cell division protein FtsI/penicillin-binding protein 2
MTRRGGRPRPATRDSVSPRRVTVMFVATVLACLLLLARMVDLQVLRGAALERLALRQQLESVQIPGRRGLIVDRMGRPLAMNVPVDSVYAVPRAIEDPDAFARRVAPVLGLTATDVRKRLGRGGPYFAWLARRLPVTVAPALAALHLGNAVGIVPETRRAYPNGALAGSVIGFVGVDDVGLAGLELAYDRMLRGASGLGTADRDAIGRELVQTLRIVTPPRDGDTLVLTLDEVVQHIAERELSREIRQVHAWDGVAIVMNPETGAILALAAVPSFDPGHYETAAPALWKNRAVADLYEPGSTFKLILAAAAIASGAVSPSDRFRDPGQIRLAGVTIHDAERSEHFDALSLSDIVKYSSNVGAAQVATRIGKRTYNAYIRQFGFGRPTGIDLPGEAAGIIRPLREWRGPTLQNIGFGQGISVTPIQLLVAAASMATRGMEVRPHLVAVVRDAGDHVVATPDDTAPHRVIAPAVAAQVLDMMRQVVAGGTGVKAQIPGYTVAGKTGTAQRPSPAGGYEPSAYVASFVGVVPASNPALAILVVVDRPHGVYYGGDVAAPVFREIARQTLWYLHVPPVHPDAMAAAPALNPAPATGGH